MQGFRSDTEFKAALNGMPLDRQRMVGKRFVESVIDLSDDPKVKTAIGVIGESDSSADMLKEHFKAAKSAAIESYTLCGHDADWLKQAAHFVAASAAICLTPKVEADKYRDLAWETAMNARMARTCERISMGKGADELEAEKQYEILSEFLSAG